MEQHCEDSAICMQHLGSGELAHLVVKLRWIALKDEAQRLQQALSMLTPEKRTSVSSGPVNTD